MNYVIHITPEAERDLADAADYIEFNLKNSQAANALLDEADSIVSSLSYMPERYPLIPDAILASLGVRSVSVKKHLIFYTVSVETATVHILRFLYGKRNWADILKLHSCSME